MVRRFVVVIGWSVLAAVSGACTQSAAPLEPSALPATGGTSSPLKVTAPSTLSPTGGVRLENTQPTLSVSEAAGSYAPVSGLTYEYEVVGMNEQLVYAATANARQHVVAAGLDADTRYRWRARGRVENRPGPWSTFAEFITVAYRGIVPRPPDGVWPNNGPDVVAYVADAFEHLLDRTSTDDERIERMKYLRDRIIETGICGGMDLGWNMKRGTPELSIDAITWKSPSGLKIIDLAIGYDDKTTFLQLHWAETIFPFYKAYKNHPGC